MSESLNGRPTDQALAGVRVLDLTHYLAGPFCTKLLADYGAEVIKLERPGSGDPARRMGPFPADLPTHGSSALFGFLNQNKLGITLNLKSTAGIRLSSVWCPGPMWWWRALRPALCRVWGWGMHGSRH